MHDLPYSPLLPSSLLGILSLPRICVEMASAALVGSENVQCTIVAMDQADRQAASPLSGLFTRFPSIRLICVFSLFWGFRNPKHSAKSERGSSAEICVVWKTGRNCDKEGNRGTFSFCTCVLCERERVRGVDKHMGVVLASVCLCVSSSARAVSCILHAHREWRMTGEYTQQEEGYADCSFRHGIFFSLVKKK